jgi:hypothetical protein
VIVLDDNIEDHPKFVSLSNEAFALWVRGIGYCRRNLTDGFIPTAIAHARARCRYPRKPIAELTTPAIGWSSGMPLWHVVADGFMVHDYLDYNPSRAEHEARLETKRWSRVHYPVVLLRDGNTCSYCGLECVPTIDHVVPRSRGGDDTPSNLVVACRSCNSRKGARTPEEAGMVLS